MPIPIIATKLFVPPVRPDAVSRPRLKEVFVGGLHKKMTLVSAPAGFGKSTLVSECVTGSDRGVAWVSLDESESDLQRFLGYVVTALRKADAGMGESVLVAMDAQQPPPTETLLTLLINDLAILDEPLLLVLDDYHALDSKEVDEALGFLLEHLPPTLHVVLATREDPMLPLARWRARGQLTEIRAADLRFTPEEAASFLSQTMKLALSDDDVIALENRTEGWVAGLQMAALSLQGRDDQGEFIQAFTGSHRFVLDYLAEEVLMRQDEASREFLLKTSILDRLNGELCDAVTGQSDGDTRLQALETENLFVVPLDDHRQWYRYHHLFGDMSRARLMQQHKALLPQLYQRASDWFKANGYPIDAVKLSLESSDVEHSASLIDEVWPDLRKSMNEALFLSWMEKLSDEQIQNRPVLAAHYGLALLSVDFEQGGRYFDIAEKWLQALPEVSESGGMQVANEEAFAELPGLVAVGRAYYAGAAGDVEGIVHHAERALDLLDDRSAIWRGSAAVLLGLVYWSMGNLEAAYASVWEGHKSLKAGGETSGAISTLFLLANIRVGLGGLREAMRLCEQGRKIADEYDGPEPQGTSDIYVALAAIKVEQNELDAAQALLDESRELGEQAVLRESQHLWHVVKARIEACLGNTDAALEQLDMAEEKQIPSPTPNPTPLSARRARVQLQAGKLSLVESWAEAHHLTADDEPVFMREFEHLVLARLLIARFRNDQEAEHLDSAQGLLERLLAAAKDGGRLQRVMEA